MKKLLSAILALAMVFSLAVSQTAFAAEADESAGIVANNEAEISPRGAIYGSETYTVGRGETKGTFYVDVTGSWWVNAKCTIEILGFESNTMLSVQVYNPNGTKVLNTDDSSGIPGLYGPSDSYTATISPGMTGTYRVEFYVTTGSAGYINCTIS